MGTEHIPWSEKTEAERTSFSDKLAYWRKYGTPGLISDEAEPFVSHAHPDGKMYTSKSEYRKDLRARGFEEKGDSHNTVQDNASTDAERISDIKHAMGEL